MAPRFATGMLCAATLLAGVPAFAQHAAQNDATSAAKAADLSDVSAGQKAAVDQTGKLRELTPSEARELVASLLGPLSQSDAGLTAVRLPNGVLALDLDGRFESATLAKIAADGTVQAECVTSVDEAEQFLGLKPGGTATEAPAIADNAPVLEER